MSQVIANFVLKFPNFRYHGNKGRSFLNLNDAIKLRILENALLVANFFTMFHINIVTANFVLKFRNFWCHGNGSVSKKIFISALYLEAMFQIW